MLIIKDVTVVPVTVLVMAMAEHRREIIAHRARFGMTVPVGLIPVCLGKSGMLVKLEAIPGFGGKNQIVLNHVPTRVFGRIVLQTSQRRSATKKIVLNTIVVGDNNVWTLIVVGDGIM